MATTLFGNADAGVMAVTSATGGSSSSLQESTETTIIAMFKICLTREKGETERFMGVVFPSN
jgi:hypothetical protein